jgi:quinol monooxygenase YgiN
MRSAAPDSGGLFVLVKVFPINLKPGKQAEVEAIVEEFAPNGPAQEPGTLSFRVYRDPSSQVLPALDSATAPGGWSR